MSDSQRHSVTQRDIHMPHEHRCIQTFPQTEIARHGATLWIVVKIKALAWSSRFSRVITSIRACPSATYCASRPVDFTVGQTSS